MTIDPAGHDAHQQAAAEQLAVVVRQADSVPDAVRYLVAALAAAEQRGYDDEKRELREEIGLLKAALKRAYRQENELRTALADRTEATT